MLQPAEAVCERSGGIPVFDRCCNGINMTGVPSFGAIDVPDQEIWSIVAFVKKLPTVSDEDFKTWTRQ